jgi:hypothetical protein
VTESVHLVELSDDWLLLSVRLWVVLLVHLLVDLSVRLVNPPTRLAHL